VFYTICRIEEQMHLDAAISSDMRTLLDSVRSGNSAEIQRAPVAEFLIIATNGGFDGC